MAQFRDRIKKLVRVPADKLRECPWNWRDHPDRQREVVRAVFSEIGVAGAAIVRELEDGTYQLIDGHLRREELQNNEVPCLVVDLDEEEAKKLLASYDPISHLASTNEGKLKHLLKDVETGSASLATLFTDLLQGDVLNPKELQLELEDDSEELVETPLPIESLPTSYVRMVQLYLNTETLPVFQKIVELLGQKYQTKNLTDTVMQALDEIYKQVKEEMQESFDEDNTVEGEGHTERRNGRSVGRKVPK